LIRRVFKVVPRKWRGVGEIPQSGLGLADDFAVFDAELRFGVADRSVPEPAECIAGEILQGLKKPHECPAFGDAVHAGASVRGDDGFERRRVRGLLSVSPARWRRPRFN
jgi:hydrogenase expression/formation protein HypD